MFRSEAGRFLEKLSPGRFATHFQDGYKEKLIVVVDLSVMLRQAATFSPWKVHRKGRLCYDFHPILWENNTDSRGFFLPLACTGGFNGKNEYKNHGWNLEVYK